MQSVGDHHEIFPSAATTHNAGESQTVSLMALDNAGRMLSGVYP